MAHITTLTRAYNDLHNSQANTYSYSGSFETFKESEVKVTLNNNNVITTLTYNSSPSDNTQYSVNLTDKTIHVGGSNLSSGTLSIYPETDLGAPTLKAPYTAGSAITASDLTNNQKQVMRRLMEFDEKKFNNDGDTMTGDLTLGEDTKIVFEGATDDGHETTLTVTDPTADRTITLPNVTGTVVTTGDTGTVATAMIAGDAVNGDKIADDSINSEHYAAGSIDHEHLANDIIDGDNIQDDVINSEHIVADSLDSEHYAPNSVDADALAHTSVTAGTYTATDLTVDAQGRITAASSGTIAGSEIAADAIDGTKLADNAVNSEHYTDASIDRVHLSADIIDGTKLEDDAVDSEHIAADSLDTEHYAPTSIDSAALASNAVTEAKITDANVTTDKIADSNVTLDKLHSNLKQTTISNSNLQLPTSGAVVSYVAAQIAPIGGLEVIADEDNFPTSQPGAGVVISISDAAGIVINGSGVSTTARTVGNGSDNVTINNFPSSLYNETLATGVGLMVSSTGSSNTYNYHKILAAETDVKQLSDDINDFNARYRVGSSNPTSALDSGDLFFNTGSGKLLVYNGTSSAWEEAQSIGQYFINTISSYSGTGGNSASFNGSAYRFVLSNPGTVAEQHIVSINGVIQKPNSGTSQPSEGFVIDGSSIIFSSAPATGADFFIITIGSTVNIGTPSDGTVTASKLTSGAVETAKLADGAVTEVKLGVSNSPTNGYFLSAQSGNTGGLTWAEVNTDLSNDTSPQLGGDLDTNSFSINIDDNHFVNFGDSSDLQIYHDASNSRIADNGTGYLINTSNGDGILFQHSSGSNLAKFLTGGACELYHNYSKKFETTSAGIDVTGDIDATDHVKINADSKRFMAGLSNDARMYHDGTDSYFDSITGHLYFLNHDTSGKDVVFGVGGAAKWRINSSGHLRPNADSTVDIGTNTIRVANGYFDTLYGDGSNLTGVSSVGGSTGVDFNDNVKARFGTGNDLEIYHDGTHSHIAHTGSGTQELIIAGNIISLNSENKQEYMLKAVEDAQVELYHNNNKKFETTSAGVSVTGNVVPEANNTRDLGTSSLRWQNVYTNDLHLSNEGHSNDVDGTWGNWTIQEGESDLFLKNNRSGKKYKFNLTEVS